jgi:serine/threonine-protein kinase HipA
VCSLSEQVTNHPNKSRKKGAARLRRAPLVEGLKAMVPALERIASGGETMGLEPEVFSHLRQYLLARAQELTALV